MDMHLPAHRLPPVRMLPAWSTEELAAKEELVYEQMRQLEGKDDGKPPCPRLTSACVSHGTLAAVPVTTQAVKAYGWPCR